MSHSESAELEYIALGDVEVASAWAGIVVMAIGHIVVVIDYTAVVDTSLIDSCDVSAVFDVVAAGELDRKLHGDRSDAFAAVDDDIASWWLT